MGYFLWIKILSLHMHACIKHIISYYVKYSIKVGEREQTRNSPCLGLFFVCSKRFYAFSITTSCVTSVKSAGLSFNLVTVSRGSMPISLSAAESSCCGTSNLRPASS
jgi:hypothetical protein